MMKCIQRNSTSSGKVNVQMLYIFSDSISFYCRVTRRQLLDYQFLHFARKVIHCLLHHR